MKTTLYFLTALILTGAVLRIFVFDSFTVEGMSMAPTIQPGDYVFVNKLAYVGDRTPQRDDVVVSEFRSVNNIKVMKRVVGLPREWVHHTGTHVLVSDTREGEKRGVIALKNPDTRATSTHSYRLDPFEYYLVGDNELLSVDSKELGPVDVYDVDGKVIALFSRQNWKFKRF